MSSLHQSLVSLIALSLAYQTSRGISVCGVCCGCSVMSVSCVCLLNYKVGRNSRQAGKDNNNILFPFVLFLQRENGEK